MYRRLTTILRDFMMVETKGRKRRREGKAPGKKEYPALPRPIAMLLPKPRNDIA
jgi:hypothetical protein